MYLHSLTVQLVKETDTDFDFLINTFFVVISTDSYFHNFFSYYGEQFIDIVKFIFVKIQSSVAKIFTNYNNLKCF